MEIYDGVITNFGQDKVLTIPKDAKELEWDVLEENDGMAEEIVVDKDNEKFITNGTVLIDKDRKSIVLGLKNAEIPFDGSVEVIGENAFLDRNELYSIILPNKIKSIGYKAFAGSDIMDITLSDNLESIENLAFWRCQKLKKVYIPKSVKTIGFGVFAGCDSLREIVVDRENENYISLNNCLIEKKSLKVIAVINNAIIPDGVTTIEKATLFMNGNCRSITIPESVVEIKEDEICKNFQFCGVYSKDESGKLEKPLTIYAEKDSFAEKFANQNGIECKTINICNPYPLNFINTIFSVGLEGDGVILNKDLMMTIETMLSCLKKEEREVFDYRFVNGMSREEIAVSLSTTEDEVDLIISKILRRLRHPLRARFLKPFLVNSGIEECFVQEEMEIEGIENEE